MLTWDHISWSAVSAVPSGPLQGVLGALILGITAVSYTHLDVYKRQANTLTPSCPAPPDPAARPPVTVTELNTLVARVDLPGWQSADIGASARLTDGRLVWVFGLSLIHI